MGDGLLLTFDNATFAVERSIAIQEPAKDIEDLNLLITTEEKDSIPTPQASKHIGIYETVCGQVAST